MVAVYCLSNKTILDHVHCNCSMSDSTNNGLLTEHCERTVVKHNYSQV